MGNGTAAIDVGLGNGEHDWQGRQTNSTIMNPKFRRGGGQEGHAVARFFTIGGFPTGAFMEYCGGTKSCTTLKPWQPLFVGILRGIIVPGFLRWCEMDFVHPQYVKGMFINNTQKCNLMDKYLGGSCCCRGNCLSSYNLGPRLT